MTDNYSFSNASPYSTHHPPASLTKRTSHTIQSEIVTPDAKKNCYEPKQQSYYEQEQLKSHESLTHVKLPDNMQNLSPKEYKSTMLHFEQQNRKYIIKQQQHNKTLNRQRDPYTTYDMTENEHIYLENQALNTVAKRTRTLQRQAEARQQQLQSRWKYSREHMDHPNPWNIQWVAHYEKMHPENKTNPWLLRGTANATANSTKHQHFLRLHLTP